MKNKLWVLLCFLAFSCGEASPPFEKLIQNHLNQNPPIISSQYLQNLPVTLESRDYLTKKNDQLILDALAGIGFLEKAETIKNIKRGPNEVVLFEPKEFKLVTSTYALTKAGEKYFVTLSRRGILGNRCGFQHADFELLEIKNIEPPETGFDGKSYITVKFTYLPKNSRDWVTRIDLTQIEHPEVFYLESQTADIPLEGSLPIVKTDTGWTTP